jgi:hypothetical protein
MASNTCKSNHQIKIYILQLAFYELEEIERTLFIKDKLKIYRFIYRLLATYPCEGKKEVLSIQRAQSLCWKPRPYDCYLNELPKGIRFHLRIIFPKL